MSKHTPGPWYFDKPDCCVGPIADKTIGVAAIMRCDGDSEKYLFGEISGANANLIAAAPDLLEALESLAVDYHRKDGLGFDLLASTKMFAAIRKAKGESQ